MKISEQIVPEQADQLEQLSSKRQYGHLLSEIISYLNDSPGASAVAIAHQVNRSHQDIATTLTYHAKRGNLQRRKQDGAWRYYPPEYRLTGTKNDVTVSVAAGILEEIAMKWSWTNNSDSLREFIAYYKDNK